MEEIFYAKSKLPNGKQPTVKEHLDLVARYAGEYGEPLDMRYEAEVAGQFHDFGKYSTAFKNVLRQTQHNVDHAICGAVLLYINLKKNHTAILEAINGHHSELVDFGELEGSLRQLISDDSDERDRMCPSRKESALAGSEEYKQALGHFLRDYPNYKFPKLNTVSRKEEPIVSMLYTRMLFSCLVDADYSVSAYEANENFFAENENIQFHGKLWLESLYNEVDYLRKTSKSESELNKIRNDVFNICGDEGEKNKEGLFTLTAPTGTGKTLALLHFALRHCIATGKKRVIIVLPYLTLAEQNTAIYKRIIPDILVDHSQSDFCEEAKEFVQRWNVPFIITTSVRFFESLFSNEPASCRKLHNIANSVVVFDEAQTLPPEVTKTTLKAVNELCKRYHTTMVFSTATQPKFDALCDISWQPREILANNAELFKKLKRTQVQWNLHEEIDLAEIAKEMSKKKSVCLIVNLRRHARQAFKSLCDECENDEESVFFLTTDLCPAHRTQVVGIIGDRLKKGLPCRVVSTQCIEAGVDLDFDVMYRSLAPLDSIIQAAGRCNRNGVLPIGKVTVFEPKDDKNKYPDSWYNNAAETVKLLNTHKAIDINDPEDISKYYSRLFSCAKDKKSLQKAIEYRNFKDTAKEYRLIENGGVRVIVPYEEYRQQFDEIKDELLGKGITPRLMKQSAAITVACYNKDITQWAESVKLRIKGKISNIDSGYYVLRKQNECIYEEKMGLQIPQENKNETAFML